MAKYIVTVAHRVVEVCHAQMEVEADSPSDAADAAYSLIMDGEEPDWGKEEIVDADYVINEVIELTDEFSGIGLEEGDV